ncbi:MAG: adenylosuccinate lyase [Candidatus Bathyarchaeota archaeon]|jgi:adenylosuccinate lyase|nr:adenylosuccinate lyase [Candidatus Bathyarchaeota archaeon]
MPNVNVLSERYATKEMNDIFSEKGRILLEREFWIAVLKAQKKLGVDISEDAIQAYEEAKDRIDLNSIREIEERTRHDVKARIEAFNLEAEGFQLIHRGLTSRDLTDNVEQIQTLRASQIIFDKYIAILDKFIAKANQYAHIIITARTHRQAAQPTVLGRRLAMWAEELYSSLIEFEIFINSYPLRGMKGPVGTQVDLLHLLGTPDQVTKFEKIITEALGFRAVFVSPGQIYPRSLDYKVASHLAFLSSACENFAKSMRLMSGHELVTEGFKEGQVGSSAMPHKMNTRSSERICGFSTLLKMYADGASRLSGDQWEEGDVSCSVVRRVIIPNMFYVSDGLCETMLTVLNEMGVYPNKIQAEVDRYMPFMASTELLAKAVTRGLGRERAHTMIRQYATAEALKLREEPTSTNTLAEKLGTNPEFPLSRAEIEDILANREQFIGNARQQIEIITKQIMPLLHKHHHARHYEPQPIL